MKHKMRVIVLLLIAVNLFCGIVDVAMVVKCYPPHDFIFKADTPAENPYQVGFNAVVTESNGTTLTLPGFFDGNATCKIRISPTAEGKWSLTTTSDLPALNGKTAVFKSIKNKNKNIHGVLRVDKEHPHHFIFDDGTRFFIIKTIKERTTTRLFSFSAKAEPSRLLTLNQQQVLEMMKDKGFNDLMKFVNKSIYRI